MQRRTILNAAAGAALYPAAAARAQQWPSNTMRWIVPFLPGTGPDITVRVVAEAMADILMQPVVVENRAVAAGMIGARLAARAPADGYHWVYTATPMASNMRMYKAPGFDVLKDFTHVSRLSNSDVMLVVNPESGIRSVGELVERMRQNPGKFDYGSGGVGSPNHLGAELLLAAAGVQATHVPFKGTVDAVNSVIGRQIDFCLPLVQVGLPHVASGRLTALAIAGPKRNPKLPNVPTLAEAGIPGVSLVSFGGLSLPAGAPPAIVERLNAAVREALDRPAVRAKLEASGGAPSHSSPEEFVELLRAEIASTERMMKVAKLEAQ